MPALHQKVWLQQVLEAAHLQARDGGQDQEVVLPAVRGRKHMVQCHFNQIDDA